MQRSEQRKPQKICDKFYALLPLNAAILLTLTVISAKITI